MEKQKKIKNINKIIAKWILRILHFAIIGVLPFLLVFFVVPHFCIAPTNYGANVVTITTAEEFVDAINANSVLKASKKRFDLGNDIILDRGDLTRLNSIDNGMGEEGALLYGKFDGNGHTIKIDHTISKPIFKQIYGTICNLKIQCKDLDGTSEDVSQSCVLAETNYGIISDIRLDINRIALDGGRKNNVAGLVNNNLGTIRCCVVTVDLVSANAAFLSDERVLGEWYSRFGAVATNNIGQGIIEDVFVKVDFVDNFVVLTLAVYNMNGSRNMAIGAAIGFWGNKENINRVCIIDIKYASTLWDIVKLADGETIDLKSEQQISKNDNNFEKWSKSIWEIENGQLPQIAWHEANV